MRSRSMRDRELGLIIMVSSLLFGAFYGISFITWLLDIASMSGRAWSWWVIALPILILVSFAVFFTAWIGWVMFSASPAKRKELLRGVKEASQEASGGTGLEARSRP
ncbi:MAG: hypothetical protein DRJ43_06715 [Thermoprotei archaeon]|nr:MAG: hypothetical protein DRJ43_06715 [Thermoprotei archaeon]